MNAALPGKPGRGRFADRTTADGLSARWDGQRKAWVHYRLNVRSNTYEETGSTRRFQP